MQQEAFRAKVRRTIDARLISFALDLIQRAQDPETKDTVGPAFRAATGLWAAAAFQIAGGFRILIDGLNRPAIEALQAGGKIEMNTLRRYETLLVSLSEGLKDLWVENLSEFTELMGVLAAELSDEEQRNVISAWGKGLNLDLSPLAIHEDDDGQIVFEDGTRPARAPSARKQLDRTTSIMPDDFFSEIIVKSLAVGLEEVSAFVRKNKIDIRGMAANGKTVTLATLTCSVAEGETLADKINEELRRA